MMMMICTAEEGNEDSPPIAEWRRWRRWRRKTKTTTILLLVSSWAAAMLFVAAAGSSGPAVLASSTSTGGILPVMTQQWLRRNADEQQQQQLQDDQRVLQVALQQVRQAGLYVCVPITATTAAAATVDLSLLMDLITKDPIGSNQFLPLCKDNGSSLNSFDETILRKQPQQRHRWLMETTKDPVDSDETVMPSPSAALFSYYLTNALCAFVCISVAALAAGLTLGMLGLDPLLLLIKERAAADPQERQAAAILRPVVQQHHRLLVTLLLMNAVANEALPLFLEALVPPAYAVLVSVTLVLFCGEIIPSAIFTGPNQLRIACALVPVVKLVMWILYPIAGPLAWFLDYLLHDRGDDDNEEHAAPTSAAYTRGELAALIRIQYEEHLAAKAKRKRQRASVVSDGTVRIELGNHVGGLDFSAPRLPHQLQHQQSIRAAIHQVDRGASMLSILDDSSQGSNAMALSVRSSASLQDKNNINSNNHSNNNNDADRRESLHVDEVTMIEGALKMNTQTAIDVFTPYRKVFCIPSDMPLTERNLVHIYASGYTRIPVHQPGSRTAVCGILMTKQLIVVDADENRQVGTLPLRTPRCVGPDTSLVTLVNLFQTGGKGSRGGHLALVCARPAAAQVALDAGDCVPEAAGLMGVITLEDVLEMLLQEQIYDEQDRVERQHHKLAHKVLQRWKSYAQHKHERRLSGDRMPTVDHDNDGSTVPPRILAVVQDAVATAKARGKSDAQAVKEGMVAVEAASEITALLSFEPTSNSYAGDDPAKDPWTRRQGGA